MVEVKKKRGEFVATEDLHLVTIVQLKTLRAVFFLPTAIASRLKSADTATVRLPLYEKQVLATVEYVAPVTEPDSGLVRVHLLIANDSEHYRSGIRCHLQLDNKLPATPQPLLKPTPDSPVRLLVPQAAFNTQMHKRGLGKDSTQWVATARSRTMVSGPATESGRVQE